MVGCDSQQVHSPNTDMSSRDRYIATPSLPPARPPHLVLTGGATGATEYGKLYVANWADLDDSVSLSPTTPVAWPIASARNAATTLEFRAPTPPVFVSLQIFAAVEEGSRLPADPETGQTTDIGQVYQECHTFLQPCMESDGSSARWSGLPETMLAREFVTVYAEWVKPLRSTDDLPGRVSASWLFHFVNE